MVAQICLSPSWGGLEMTALKLTKQFIGAGIPSGCFCLEGSPLEKELKNQGLIHYSIPSGFDYFSITRSLEFKRIVEQQGIDVVFHHRLRDLWMTRLSREFGLQVREFGFAHMMLNNVKKKGLVHTWVYSGLERLIVMTPSQKRNLLKALPVEDERYVMIPNAIDTDKFSPSNDKRILRDEYGIGPNSFCIGLVGRLDPQKGQLEAIKALSKMVKEDPDSDFKLILVGATTIEGDATATSFHTTLENTARSLGVSDRVIFAGHRNNMQELYSSFDVFIMPSYEETFGYVLIEAMACGVPSVATAAGGPLDIIDDEFNGLLVRPKSSTALYHAMMRINSDKELAQTLSQNGRKKVEQFYNQEKVFKAIQTLATINS